jgi:hypothetical protein
MLTASRCKSNTTVGKSNYLLDKNGFVMNEDHIYVTSYENLHPKTLTDGNKTIANYNRLVYVNKQMSNAVLSVLS